MIDKNTLNELHKDFKKVSEVLKLASTNILRKNFYYPIFIVSKKSLNFFPLLLAKKENFNNYYYYAVYLDFLLENNLIDISKKSFFESNYKDPQKFCCLLFIDENINKLIFCPYQ